MPVDPERLKVCRRDPGSLLARQLEALAGDQPHVTIQRERPWASITFTGTRHSFAVNWPNAPSPDQRDNIAKTIAEHEFAIPGYFVADMLVTERSETQFLVEALLIIDPVEDSVSD
ncbi:hypothetical protein [Parasphingorhabdus sp.]|uniref:hypothetical protein n=1 Tax=Parasphingorhabdus sp. TaxID=2709688 RepID=UPI003A8F23A1